MKLYGGGRYMESWELHGPGYWYLASPYSKYPNGIEQAFEDVCEIAAWCVKEKIATFSPIAHTHPIAMFGNLDPLDHEIWLGFDQPMIDGSRGMLFAEMPGWKDSFGMNFELKEFEKAGKPIVHIVEISK